MPNRRKYDLAVRDFPEYGVWSSMKSRCLNPQHRAYKNYGARGITVCARWKNSFSDFISDVGRRPSGSHTLERINNNGNYEPGNVCWATYKEQIRNTRRTVQLTYNGETLCIVEWAERLSIPASTIYTRINKHGWDVERALSQPRQNYPLSVRKDS